MRFISTLALLIAMPTLASTEETAAGGTPASNWRGRNGTRVTYACTADSLQGSVYGTDVYTDDSSVCRAALHAGVIGARGGRATIEIRPGLANYAASTRNGVQSTAWGSFAGSFRFVGKGATPVDDDAPQAIDWTGTATHLRGQNGIQVEYACPAGQPGTAYGTDVYTDDSSICTAAVHAGLIGARGGKVRIEIMPGQASYRASTRHGVTTNSYGNWTGSFRFVTVTPATWQTKPSALRGKTGQKVTYSCPSAGDTMGPVWGKGVYSDDSSVCAAGRHAGAIGSAGGLVTIEILPGREAYEGSVANGVTSSAFGPWAGSFSVVKR
jgi:hypothetical protein